MRIAIDIRPLLERQPGGVASYASRLVRALLEKPAHEYALFCNAFGKAGSGQRAAGSLLDSASCQLPAASFFAHHYPNKALNASFAFLQRPLLEDLSGGADAVYLPNLNFVATRKPYVVTIHDLSFMRYPRFFSAKQRLWHAAVRPKKLVTGAAAVVAVSRHTKADIVETFGLPADAVAVVPPAADASYSPRTPSEIARVTKKYGLPERYFLSLGTIEPRKNIRNIIAAFERLAGDETLVIAGGKGWLCRDTFERAARSPARDRIRFIGYVHEADKPALYSAAIALVYPSFYEGFGMPPLEAMACGTPVIASHVTSLGEVVGDAGMLVDPYNASELADAMAAVRDSSSLASELKKRGLERSRMFSWKKSAAALEGVFNSLSRKP